MAGKRIKIGDVIEIKTSIGLAYAIYTHKHVDPPKYGSLIRVFDKTFATRPLEIRGLLFIPSRFETFIPLQAFVSRGIFSIVGNLDVPEEMQTFPLFRAGFIDPNTRKVSTWWLWDGKEEWPIGSLSAEERKLPIREIWGDGYLVTKIEQGWKPENDAT